jgi:hypothetical protein
MAEKKVTQADAPSVNSTVWIKPIIAVIAVALAGFLVISSFAAGVMVGRFSGGMSRSTYSQTAFPSRMSGQDRSGAYSSQYGMMNRGSGGMMRERNVTGTTDDMPCGGNPEACPQYDAR